MKKGVKKYVCGNCRAVSNHHWVEANRSGGVRCESCGSRDMTMVAKEARDQAAFAAGVAKAGGTASAPRQQYVRRSEAQPVAAGPLFE